jgi:O-succinylbenzoic acid--CoA ligase
MLGGPGDAARLIAPLEAALAGTGPAVLPVDTGLPAARIAAILDAFAPGEVLDDGRAPAARWSEKGQGVDFDTAVIIATSGTTGAPKGVELSAAALLASARASLARAGARDGERWLACLPVTHVAGLQVLVRSLAGGTRPAVAAVADAGSMAAAAADGASHVSLVPTQLVRLMGSAAGRQALAMYASVLVGGAAAGAAALSAARAAGVRVITTYGMSETCGGCVYDGVPLDGVSVRTSDDGRLRIAGPVLMNRYYGQPELTAAALVRCDPGARTEYPPGPPEGDPGARNAPRLPEVEFVTSDLGVVGADGIVTVRGRADDVINTGGHKVIPGEVAAALSTCPSVREVVVVGRADAEWGERVVAVVVPAEGIDPPTLELLRTHVLSALPRYACPSEVVLVDALPALPNGKPDLALLAGHDRWSRPRCGPKSARTLR